MEILSSPLSELSKIFDSEKLKFAFENYTNKGCRIFH